MEVENQLLKQDTEYLKKEVAELKKTTSDGFIAINLKLDIMAEKYVRREEVDREFERIDEDIKGIKSNLSKAVWIVLTAVILAVLGLVLINS